MGMSTEKKVGLFFLLSLIALAVLIEFVEEIKPFQDQVEYVAYFNSLVGLNEGDPVRLSGVQVGKVKSIELEDYRIRVVFAVKEGTAVKPDSYAKVQQTNLLGGQFLGLSFGSEEQPYLEPGSAVPTKESTNIDQLLTDLDHNLKQTLGELSDFVAEGREGLTASLEHLRSVLRKVDDGEGTFGKLVNDDDLYEEVSQISADLKDLTGRLRKGEGTLGRLFTDESLYVETREALGYVRDIAARLKEGEGTLGRLLVDDELHTQTVDAMANIRELTEKVNNGEGTLGRLINEDELYEDTAETMSRVHSIVVKIDDGQGTVGRLINEDDIYRDVRTTLNKVEKTVDGLSDSGPLTAVGVVMGTLF